MEEVRIIGVDLAKYVFQRHGAAVDGRADLAQICKRIGNLWAVKLLLGQTRMNRTVRYLGVDLDDALSLSDGIAP